MLKRVYINNYKCCVNFELKLDSINLLLGDNGSGKSTVFEVLHKLQHLICRNGRVQQLFSTEHITRWQSLFKQRFEIELEGNNGVYQYELEIEQSSASQLPYIKFEKLFFNQKPLIITEDAKVHLYNDDHSLNTRYPFVYGLSAIATQPPDGNTTKLNWFKERLAKIIMVQINPMLMESESSQEFEYLDLQCRNFVDWYRSISQDQGRVIEINNALKEVINGFQYFEFKKTGENTVLLKVQISGQSYRFHELSHGQRVLIVLYTLVHYAQSQGCTLCIDEPENFVSLSEIQPWIFAVKDFCADGKMQAVLISHHPEYINDLAESAGIWFERNPDSPVRIRKINHNGELALSELVARGWINE